MILSIALYGYPHLNAGKPLRIDLQPRHPAKTASAASPQQPSRLAPSDTGSDPILPDSILTPGATFPVTAKDLCTPGYAKVVRHVTAKMKRQVYAEYGIPIHRPGDYEIDHLVSLELGGSNSIKNLWPESYKTEPWNAHVKDAVENRLHSLVCAGKLPLERAQREIASDWIAAYKRYFGRKLPVPKPTR